LVLLNNDERIKLQWQTNETKQYVFESSHQMIIKDIKCAQKERMKTQRKANLSIQGFVK